jgi:hypothetical protein
MTVVLCSLMLTFAGCKSTPKVDWNSRVGSYTYDQAVAELGPPDKFARLSDGSAVAEWIKRSSGGMSFGFGVGSYGSHGGVGVGQSVGSGYDDKVLRLTFDQENKLSNWTKNY